MALLHLDIERRAVERLPRPASNAIRRVDDIVTGLLERYGITALRVALSVVFIWFGALKVAGRSPVEDLVAETVFWLPAGFVVPFIGAWEIAVGLGLLVPVALRLTLALFWAQMAGTFLVLLVQRGDSFQGGNPLMLTVTGEFVVKNLVLIAAGLVVGSQVRKRSLVSRRFDDDRAAST